MAINERLIHSAAAETAAGATGNQEDGLLLYLDANDIDSYDGVDGATWYNIANHEYTPAVDPSDHFNTVTYSGNSSTNAITGVGFQPDLVWIKRRNTSASHYLNDSLTPNSYLRTDTNDIDTTSSTFTSFDSDGFTLASSNLANNSAGTYVAWCLKAGGTPTSSTPFMVDGTGYATMSAAGFTDGTEALDSLSVNTKLGFSIAKWSGAPALRVDTVAHGLGETPEMIILKSTSVARNWNVFHKDVGTSKNLHLNTTDAANTSEDWTANSTTFSIQDYSSSADWIAYCFTSKRGVSKVGSYEGNSSNAGVKVYTGFEPSFIMFKPADAATGWSIHDNKRGVDKQLNPNISAVESTGWSAHLEFHSDGFKVKGASSGLNPSSTMIYLAFAAEKPSSLVNSVLESIDSNSVSSITHSATTTTTPTIDGGIRDTFSGSLVQGENFGFGATGNSEGTNYFTLTLNQATAFKKFAVYEMYQSGYRYTGNVKVYGSNDNSNFTLIAQTSQTTSVQFNRNETDISDTTEYLYYKFDFYGNSRGTYQGAFRIELITDQDINPELHLDPASYSGSGTTWTADAGNNATLNGNMSYDQELGDFFDLDGAGDYASLNTSGYLDGDFTVEMWWNFDVLSGYKMLWGASGYGGTGSGLGHYIDGATIKTWTDVNGTTTNPVTSGSVLEQGKWHHIVLTRSGSTFTQYVDGNQVGTASGTNASLDSANTYIGSHYNAAGTYDVNGKVGQVRVYNKALAAEKVMQNYRFTKNDYPANGHAAINGATFTPAAGYNPDFFAFDGSNDYMELDYIHPSLLETTATLWIKFADVTPSQNDYFISGTSSSGSNANNNLHLGLMTDGRLYAEYGSNWAYLTASAAESDLSNDTWAMLSFVWSGSSIKYYKNGVLKTTTSGFSNIGNVVNTTKLHLGRFGAYNGYYAEMDIGQLKIYDKELTANELVAEFDKHKADYGL